MTEKQPNSKAVKSLTWGAGLLAWLAARPRGRWATARGRWVQTVLTSGLLLTGLTAWALALVQPWTAYPGDHGIVTFVNGVDTARIRAASTDIEKLCRSRVGAPPQALGRNPFASPVGSDAISGRLEKGSDPLVGEKGSGPSSERSEKAPDPLAILEVVRNLRLEVTLITPAGERWAVIDGVNYREGDTIAGMEIVEIQEGRVKLRQAGMTCLLRID